MRNASAADIRQDHEPLQPIVHNGGRWLTIVDVFTWRERVNDFLRNIATYFLVNATLIIIVFFSISHLIWPHKFSRVGGDRASLNHLWYGFSIFWGLLTAFYNGMLVVQGFKWIKNLWNPSENAKEIYLKRSGTRQTSFQVTQRRQLNTITSDVECTGHQELTTKDLCLRADKTTPWLGVTAGPVGRINDGRGSAQSRYSMVRNEPKIDRGRKTMSPDLYSIRCSKSQPNRRVDKSTSSASGIYGQEQLGTNQSSRSSFVPTTVAINDQLDGFSFPCMSEAGPSPYPQRLHDGCDMTKDKNPNGLGQSMIDRELWNMRSNIASSEIVSTADSIDSRMSFYSVASKHMKVDSTSIMEELRGKVFETDNIRSTHFDQQYQLETEKLASTEANMSDQDMSSGAINTISKDIKALSPQRGASPNTNIHSSEDILRSLPSFNFDGPSSDDLPEKRPKLSKCRQNTRVLAYDVVTEHYAKRNRISSKRRAAIFICVVLSPLTIILSIALVTIPIYATCLGPRTMHDYIFDHACGANTWNIRLVGKSLLGTKDHVQAYFENPRTNESFSMILQPIQDVHRSDNSLLYVSSSDQLYKYNHQDKKFIEEIFPLLVQYDFRNSTYWTPKSAPEGVSAPEREYFRDFSPPKTSDKVLVMDSKTYSFPFESLWIDNMERNGECGEPKIVLKDQFGHPAMWTVFRKRTDCSQLMMCAASGTSRRQVVIVAGKVLQRMIAVTDCCISKDKF